MIDSLGDRQIIVIFNELSLISLITYIRVTGMMRKYTKIDIQTLKVQQKRWQNLYEQTLKQLQIAYDQYENDDDYQRFTLINEYIIYVVNKKSCDLCSKAGTYKFIRTAICQPKQSPPFMLCDDCYFSESLNRLKHMRIQMYVPVSSVVINIKSSIKQLRRSDQIYEDSYARYESYQNQLQYMINQLANMFQRNLSTICKCLRKQFQILKKHTHDDQCSQVFDIFLKQEHWKIDQSCLAQSNTTRSNRQEESFRWKMRQNQFIKELETLQTVALLKTGQQNKIMNQILQDLENVMIKQSAALQSTLKKIARQTQQYSLVALSKQWQDKLYQRFSEQAEQKIISTSKQNYIANGVINSITHDHINQINNKIAMMEIHTAKNMESIVQKIYEASKIQTLKIANNEVASVFVEDMLQYSQYNQQSSDRKLDSLKSKMYAKLSQQLKQLEFNCKVSYKKDFLASLHRFVKLQNLCLTWNLHESFQSLNEAYHYLQDHHCINSLAPSPIDLLQLYKAAKMRYLWIGNCDNSIKGPKSKTQMQKYLQILNFSRQCLKGIMLGQFDGRQRKISAQIVQNINMLQNIKTIYFNKISFTQQNFLLILSRHNRIQSLSLNDCDNLTEHCLTKINYLPRVKKILLTQLRQLQWKQQMPTLQCFILQRCFCNSLNNVFKQSKLKTLSLYECHFLEIEFIQDLLVSQIKNGAFLSSVNLGYTKINNRVLDILDNFSQIRKLNISGTRIDLFSLMVKLKKGEYKNLRKISKLSLKEMKQIAYKIQSNKMSEEVNEYYNDVFANILAHFPVLIHLDISHNSVINQRSIRLGLRYLAFVTVTQTKFSLQSKNKHKISEETEFYSSRQQDLKVIY